MTALIFIIIATSVFWYLVISVGTVMSACTKKHKVARTIHSISVIIPAYNEEYTVARTVNAVYASRLPKDVTMEVIAVNDGSTDCTMAVLYGLSVIHPTLVVHNQANGGKGNALNNASQLATGEIMIIMDADSSPTPTAIAEIIKTFEERPDISAVASNIRIRKTGSVLNYIQYIEYVIGWQSKRATDALGIEYILGGIGSAFRLSAFREIGGYDTDTQVEDMDVTFKLFLHDKKIGYAHKAIIYTESAPSMTSLLKQRNRWKFGHMQVLWKYHTLFFGTRIPARLSFFMLPFAVFREILLLVEPVIPLLIVYLLFVYGDWMTVLAGLGVVTIATTLRIWQEDTLSVRERVTLTLSMPAMYFLLYCISFVWYVSGWRSVFAVNKLTTTHGKWVSTQRI